MSTENRRNFLRNLIAGTAAVVVARAAPVAAPSPEPAPEPKIITVEKIMTVERDIPNNVTGSEMEIWLTITARRRNKEWAEKRKAQVDVRYFGNPA